MTQGVLPLQPTSLRQDITYWLYVMLNAGITVRAIKLSVEEFMRLRVTFPHIYERGYLRILFVRRGRRIVHDIRIQLVKEPRWTS